MSKVNPKVAFIIVCYNNKDLLKQCFESIKSQTYSNHTIVMIDNGSKDDSVEFTRTNYPEVRLIDSGFNNGFARGNNIAIKEALLDKGVQYVALINTDATLDENWLLNMVEFASLRPKAALMQGLTLDYFNHEIIDSTHIYLDPNGLATQGNWRNRIASTNLNYKKVMGVNAAAALYSRKFLEAQPFEEFFDEGLFMYLEDVDISLRATIMGWDNYFVKDAIAYHMGSVSSGKNPGFSLRMTFRNNLPVLVKNLPPHELLKILLKMPITDLRYVRELISKKQTKNIKQLVLGRLSSVFVSFSYVQKRKQVRKFSNISKEYLTSLMEKGY